MKNDPSDKALFEAKVREFVPEATRIFVEVGPRS